MKKYLLIICLSIISIGAQAQTQTYNIDWSFGSNPSASGDANADRTIEEGDTVTWTWYANGNHNVVSNADATESFSSQIEGPGFVFSHTFTQVGTNSYVCTPHSGSMFGTITVVPEGTLNATDFFTEESISLYPNPTQNLFYLNIENNIADVKVDIYNTLGQKIKIINHSISKDEPIDVSDLNSGLYLVRVTDGQNAVIKRLIIE